jgi:hypothetical protein
MGEEVRDFGIWLRGEGGGSASGVWVRMVGWMVMSWGWVGTGLEGVCTAGLSTIDVD